MARSPSSARAARRARAVPERAADPAPIRRAAVVGTTGWGVTIAILLARNGVSVTLLARGDEEAARLRADGAHPRLPGVAFPSGLAISADRAALEDADLICLVVPAQTMAENAAALAAHVPPSTPLLSGSKGIETGSGRRMTEVLAALLPGRPLAVLSGPNLSREVVAGLPGATVIASTDPSLEAIRAAFHSASFRVYTSGDVVGVEFGGALKNIIAIAAGMADAFGFGDNAKAALVARGLAEISRLGVAAGADPLTFQGLAGVGDVIASSYSPLARNRRLGELIGGGASPADALAMIGETVEGVSTTPAVLRLAAQLGVELPIAQALQAILDGKISPQEAMVALLERGPMPELA